ncbi:hypothetical protein K469DRAFT_580803, partial [Zopfia rhizophila CBS 207.26]
RKDFIYYSYKFVSLMGIYYQQYKEKAFFINNKGRIVSQYVKSRIIVNIIYF